MCVFHACRTHVKGDNIYKTLIWKPDGKRELGIPRRKGKVNVKTSVKNILWGWWMDRCDPTQDKVLGSWKRDIKIPKEIYRIYCSLNIFRAPLCPSSGAQNLYGLLLLMVLGALVYRTLVWCETVGYMSGFWGCFSTSTIGSNRL